jgi:membrane associated rhomboid family serine protease
VPVAYATLAIFPVKISAWFFLGFWFLYQLFEANFGIFGASANGGGVAFFAHVGGFVFGAFVTLLLSINVCVIIATKPPAK